MTQSVPFKVSPSAHPRSTEQRNEILNDPGFGKFFTDHMVVVEFNREKGWHNAELKAYGSLEYTPAMMAFHYGQAVFDAHKAYRTPNNDLVMFRPEKNAQRLSRSAVRMAMPEIDESIFIEACDLLVKADAQWVPEKEGQSLYLRSLMIASEEHMGLRASDEYLFILMASPVSPFFQAISDVPALSVFATSKYVRAVEGGTGSAKAAGNYGASLIAKDEAYAHDCQDVLWRDAKEHKYIEEMGTSNVSFVSRGQDGSVTLRTPAVTGTLLEGITRDSILTLARDRGYEVREVALVYDEVIEEINSGAITEAFSCGTAVTIAPIGTIVSDDAKTVVGDGKAGEISMSLRKELIDIQFGRVPDKHHWLHLVK